MQVWALKLLFQSLIVLLDMEFSLKKINPTCLTSLLMCQGHFMLIELKIMLDSECGLY